MFLPIFFRQSIGYVGTLQKDSSDDHCALLLPIVFNVWSVRTLTLMVKVNSHQSIVLTVGWPCSESNFFFECRQSSVLHSRVGPFVCWYIPRFFPYRRGRFQILRIVLNRAETSSLARSALTPRHHASAQVTRPRCFLCHCVVEFCTTCLRMQTVWVNKGNCQQ